ncbi:MAG: hypothetical protein HOH43_14195 [Candidatus Latescibacteria bacterium]|nr:hypothetical protein [Candidatus Latescibacterota bacterium]
MKYKDDQEIIAALISHLGLVKYKSRTPPPIARAIGVGEEDVTRVLHGYPGIFRKSNRKKADTEEHYYTLQIRYAIRADQYKKNYTSAEGTPLDVDHVMRLLEYVSHHASREQELHLTQNQLQQERELTHRDRELTREMMKQDLDIAKASVESANKASSKAYKAAFLAAVAAVATAILEVW